MSIDINSVGSRVFMVGLLFLSLVSGYYCIKKLKVYEWIVAVCIGCGLTFLFIWIGCPCPDVLDSSQPYLSLSFLVVGAVVGWCGQKSERRIT